MRGLILCLIVVVTVDAVRSQGPPTQTKKGKRPSRRNDNPDFGLPSGADIPDGRRMSAGRPAAPPAAGRAVPPASAARPAAAPAARGPAPAPRARPAAAPAARGPAPAPRARPAPAAAPAAPPAANRLARPSIVRSGPPPPRMRPAARNDNPDRGLPSGRDVPDNRRTRTRSGPPPAARAPPASAGRRNDNPDFGLPSGRDFPDRGFFSYAAPAAPAAPPAPAAPAPVFACDYYCQFEPKKPVCTVNGDTYDNDCLRECRNEPRACENACPCTGNSPDPYSAPVGPFGGPCDYCHGEGYSPVCVDNEENYQNECFARCEGKTVTCTDACPCN